MSQPRVRALVLAAGFGVRLRPLTLFLPKPLLPVAGVPVAGHTLRQLAKAGCELAVLNLHHLAAKIPEHFGRTYFGMPLRYSVEEEIQGTYGALFAPRRWLRDAEAVVLVNGDSWSDWPLARMIRQHVRSGVDVTLLLHKRQPDAALGGGVGVGVDGRIVSLRDSEPIAPTRRHHVFAGLHVLSPKILDLLRSGPGDIITDLYLPLLREGGRIQAFQMRSAWHDLGTPGRYFAATQDALGGPFRWLAGGSEHRSPLARVHEGAIVRQSALEADVEIGERVEVDRSILLDGARIGAGSNIRECILGPGVRLPASTNVERRMINRLPAGYQTGPHDTVMGDLVYTPLEV